MQSLRKDGSGSSPGDSADDVEERLDACLRALGAVGEDLGFARRVCGNLPRRRWWWSLADAQAAFGAGLGGVRELFASGRGGEESGRGARVFLPWREAFAAILMTALAVCGMWLAAHEQGAPGEGVRLLEARANSGAETMKVEGAEWWDAPDAEIAEDLDWLQEELVLAALSFEPSNSP